MEISCTNFILLLLFIHFIVTSQIYTGRSIDMTLYTMDIRLLRLKSISNCCVCLDYTNIDLQKSNVKFI